MDSVSKVLEGLFKGTKDPLSDFYRLKQLYQAWPRLLKEEVFLNTMPVKYNKGQLFVYLPHASQLQDVIFLRNQIAKRVNRFFDESWVLEVRLTLDKNSIPSRNY